MCNDMMHYDTIRYTVICHIRVCWTPRGSARLLPPELSPPGAVAAIFSTTETKYADRGNNLQKLTAP